MPVPPTKNDDTSVAAKKTSAATLSGREIVSKPTDLRVRLEQKRKGKKTGDKRNTTPASDPVSTLLFLPLSTDQTSYADILRRIDCAPMATAPTGQALTAPTSVAPPIPRLAQQAYVKSMVALEAEAQGLYRWVLAFHSNPVVESRLNLLAQHISHARRQTVCTADGESTALREECADDWNRLQAKRRRLHARCDMCASTDVVDQPPPTSRD